MSSSALFLPPLPRPAPGVIPISLADAQNAAAAMGCGGLGAAIFCPLDVLRARWQTDPTAGYSTAGGGKRPFPFGTSIDVLNGNGRASGRPEWNHSTILRFANSIIRNEGFFHGLWAPGLLANSLCVCVSASRTALYPAVRDGWIRLVEGAPPSSGLVDRPKFVGLRTTGTDSDDRALWEKKRAHHMCVAGILSGAIGYWLATPFFQAKNRMQAAAGLVCPKTGVYTTGAYAGQPGPKFDGLLDCLRTIVKEGRSIRRGGWELGGGSIGAIASLWRGALPLTMRGSALTAGQFVSYDLCKEHFLAPEGKGSTHSIADSYRLLTAPFRTDGPPLHFLASAIAAVGAATCCTPFDVLVIRYQTASISPNTLKKPSALRVLADIVHKEGLFVLYRGWTPMFASLLANCCFYMPLYEQFRYRILNKYFR